MGRTLKQIAPFLTLNTKQMNHIMNLQEQSLAQLRILLAAMPQMPFFDKQRQELKAEIKRREKPINIFENISDYEKFANEYIYN